MVGRNANDATLDLLQVLRREGHNRAVVHVSCAVSARGRQVFVQATELSNKHRTRPASGRVGRSGTMRVTHSSSPVPGGFARYFHQATQGWIVIVHDAPMKEPTTSRASVRGDLEPTPIYDAVSVLLQARCHPGRGGEETAATSVTADEPVPAEQANAM
ncbi:hypothetical protein [Amycolatopsis sp. SID8362]|uniref:hypothetical protein n=1 Tax=Amycolatopsis sp. SID8362 TaxID=2690346 RepID=UPI001368D3D1|nr:hypothetical protein [Amycolatopsis sp. SID8362]NBH03339.1 hypothetical protein [Amycolatopsis sp. SID8362]NED40040.1 hypothetical protein [Amycolatopsis sp. SID8362]